VAIVPPPGWCLIVRSRIFAAKGRRCHCCLVTAGTTGPARTWDAPGIGNAAPQPFTGASCAKRAQERRQTAAVRLRRTQPPSRHATQLLNCAVSRLLALVRG